jgi:hypothetical protein
MLRLQNGSIAGLLGATALILAACDEEAGPRQHREGAFAWTGSATPGMTVRVRDFNGDITVEPSPDTMVRVTADITWRRGDPDQALHFTGAREGNEIIVCAVWGEGSCTASNYTSNFNFSRGSTDAKVHFKLQVPAGVLLELRGVNGSITAAASAPVEARTTNGDIRVVTAVGPVRGETTSGDVDLRMTSLTGTDSVIARSMTGDVYVYLPESAAASIDLATTNGAVSTEFQVLVTGAPSRRRLQATLGAGTHPVRLRTLNGDASLRKLDAQGRSAAP